MSIFFWFSRVLHGVWLQNQTYNLNQARCLPKYLFLSVQSFSGSHQSFRAGRDNTAQDYFSDFHTFNHREGNESVKSPAAVVSRNNCSSFMTWLPVPTAWFFHKSSLKGKTSWSVDHIDFSFVQFLFILIVWQTMFPFHQKYTYKNWFVHPRKSPLIKGST